MVTQRYLLSRPPPPGAVRRFLNQRVLPAAIDLAAQGEACAERVAVSARARPMQTLAVAFLAAAVLGVLRRRRARKAREDVLF